MTPTQRNGPVRGRMVVSGWGRRSGSGFFRVGAGQGATDRGEGVVQVVDGPGDDDDVVDVQPEGQHSSGKTHTWEQTHQRDTRLVKC